MHNWLHIDIGVDAMSGDLDLAALASAAGEGDPEDDLDDVAEVETDMTAFARAHRERRRSFHGDEPCCREFYDIKMGR